MDEISSIFETFKDIILPDTLGEQIIIFFLLLFVYLWNSFYNYTNSFRVTGPDNEWRMLKLGGNLLLKSIGLIPALTFIYIRYRFLESPFKFPHEDEMLMLQSVLYSAALWIPVIIFGTSAIRHSGLLEKLGFWKNQYDELKEKKIK